MLEDTYVNICKHGETSILESSNHIYQSVSYLQAFPKDRSNM